MSNTNTEKRNRKPSKLSLNRETLRILSGEKLDEIVGGLPRTSSLVGVTCEGTFDNGCTMIV